MVNVEADALDPGEIAEGLTTHVIPVGAEQERVIWPLNPPTELALIFSVAEPPRITVVLWAVRLKEKSGALAAAAGARLANMAVALPPVVGKLG